MKAIQNEGESEQQAARGAYDPAYLNYTMGKLMIRKLRSDWCAKQGGPTAGMLAQVPRRVPVVWRSADSAGARRHDE